MIKNVQKNETIIHFDITLILMNSIDHEAYDLTKYHFEKMRELTLIYTIKKPKIIKMKFKNMNSITIGAESTHKNKKPRNEKTCFYCKKKPIISKFNVIIG